MVLTQDQEDEFVAAFDYFSRGKNKIDRVDLTIIFDSLGNLEKPSSEELQDFYDLVDCDGLGISLNPFLEFMSQQVKQDPLENLKQAFRDIDEDGSGSIDRDELKVVMLKMMGDQMTEEEIDGMIDEADMDGDGEIDFEEFVMLFQKDKPDDK